MSAPPIDTLEGFDRFYIPLPGGWEIQTKGKGSSFRICNTKTGDRVNVCERHIHGMLECMAREVYAACEGADVWKDAPSPATTAKQT